jgi:hypothetical protein
LESQAAGTLTVLTERWSFKRRTGDFICHHKFLALSSRISLRGSVSYDTGGVDPQSQQLLLELISGDLTEIGRKYLEAWKGEPFVKFRLISNKVPNFNDEVLVTRFNVIEFTKSFLGKENPALKRELLPSELPGIANRCLVAYRRLLRRGRFVQPRSGLVLVSPVLSPAWISVSSPLLERATMSQISSLPQPTQSVSRVLTADTRHKRVRQIV